jgi:hypothetical protein
MCRAFSLRMLPYMRDGARIEAVEREARACARLAPAIRQTPERRGGHLPSVPRSVQTVLATAARRWRQLFWLHPRGRSA